MEIKNIYSLRANFSIIGLTGKTGSGCTEFSRIICRDFKSSANKMLRMPDEIKYIDDLYDKNTVFKRKYNIAFNYFKKESTPYKTISYLSVILFYIIHYCVFKKKTINKDKLIDCVQNLIGENFRKSITKRDDDYTNVKISREEISALCDYDLLICQFKRLKKDFKKRKDSKDLITLNEVFFGHCFTNFADRFYRLIGSRDYYLGAFFVHRIGNKIRGTGDPFELGDLKEIANPKYIYTLAYVINKLIGAWKIKNEKCHICIDSLRNSLEIMFFKERYSSFYMIAIHNEGRHKERICERIRCIYKLEKIVIPNEIEKTVEKLISLDEIERRVDDFKMGYFYAPDVENCIQKSEIHINNPGLNFEIKNNLLRDTTFYSMREQWIRIKALISHPGILTPTQEERCMQIAFNSKFNSGCISRQVGAVITDSNHSIRSVGWNDVPKGSIPCNIRTLSDIISPTTINIDTDKSYSEFELNNDDKSYKNGGNFAANTKIIFAEHVRLTQELGLNHSFCFKSLHNQYEHKDNQVHTRSLHAEENAMLQISKHGGQPLMGGTLYTTASPCELCAKKAYQLGISKIIYIDPYPGISMQHVLSTGYKMPETKMFTGIIGKTYNNLFEPLLSYKDELGIITSEIKNDDKLLENIVIEFLETNLKIKLQENTKIGDIKNTLKDYITE